MSMIVKLLLTYTSSTFPLPLTSRFALPTPRSPRGQFEFLLSLMPFFTLLPSRAPAIRRPSCPKNRGEVSATPPTSMVNMMFAPFLSKVETGSLSTALGISTCSGIGQKCKESGTEGRDALYPPSTNMLPWPLSGGLSSTRESSATHGPCRGSQLLTN
ncbi:hypothetical protein CALVIDRAFT_412125 [Calocera viscosa TUFC12733]|uniref:Uncharacterized protein n=1 Tax=Calocera viscosa (strain TUFC12733) TaxID=1330018 RepID=A0A167G5D6_CALVF|nr:hypothetical protein CALVIDRAFT_412125 [Calocera viscosa TUFC12733]